MIRLSFLILIFLIQSPGRKYNTEGNSNLNIELGQTNSLEA